jgi:hypothetical protein
LAGFAFAGIAADDLKLWREFVAALRNGEITADRIKPYYEQFKEPLLGFLKEMREKATWSEWEAAPEIHRVEKQVHFLLPLTFDRHTTEYCFTLLDEGGAWHFQHMEAINIRLDKTGPLPTSTFPDVAEETKAHIREETHWSREVRVFNTLVEAKGKDFAFGFFKDGDGYFLAARVWVPFVEPRKAFILYLCWEQANLTGNEVTLENLTAEEASVRMRTYFFRLYRVSGHLRQQISFDDYKRIFETIWQDRARAAGWGLTIEYVDTDYPGSECLLRFRRPG